MIVKNSRNRQLAPGNDLSAAADAVRSDAELSALVARIADGDHAALGKLYDSTVGKVYAIARMIVHNSSDAEEVTCDVYAQVWRTAERYASSRGSVLAWLLMICRTRALDLLRQRKAHVDLYDADPGVRNVVTPPEELLEHLQRGTATHKALNALSPLRKQLVGMAFLQGISHDEIARSLNLPIGTVKSHIRRSLAVLRLYLGDLEAEGIHSTSTASALRLPARGQVSVSS